MKGFLWHEHVWCTCLHVSGDYLGGEAYWAGGLHLYTPLPFRPGKGGFGDLFRTHFFLNAGNLCNLNYGGWNIHITYYKHGQSNMVEKIIPMKVCVQVTAPRRTFRGLRSAFAGRMEQESCCDSATLPGWSWTTACQWEFKVETGTLLLAAALGVLISRIFL